MSIASAGGRAGLRWWSRRWRGTLIRKQGTGRGNTPGATLSWARLGAHLGSPCGERSVQGIPVPKLAQELVVRGQSGLHGGGEGREGTAVTSISLSQGTGHHPLPTVRRTKPLGLPRTLMHHSNMSAAASQRNRKLRRITPTHPPCVQLR